MIQLELRLHVHCNVQHILTTKLECVEHRSLVLFNHRHQKGSDLMPCNGSIDENKQEAGGNVFSTVVLAVAKKKFGIEFVTYLPKSIYH